MKVMIVDDHPLVRQGVASVLSLDPTLEITDQAGSVKEALAKLKNVNPDIMLIDLRLGDGTGLDLIEKAREQGYNGKFVILTSSMDEYDFQKAMEMNVSGYLLKEAFPEEVLSAIRLVDKGRKYFDPGIMELAVTKEKEDIYEELTPREHEVLKALGQGLSNRDIARQLYITEFTVKKHVSQILSKLELNDRTQAALYAQSKRKT